MTPVLWFGVALIGSLVYSARVQSRLKPAVQLDWRWALVCVASIVVGTLIALRTGVSVEGRSALIIHTGALFVFAWLGLRFWTNWAAWRVCVPVLALACAFAYTMDRFHWNNAIVVFAALAVVPAAMHLTRSWAYVAYLSLAALDAYAVWGSDVMVQMVSREQATFPSGLVLTQSVLPFLKPVSANLPPAAIHIQQTAAWMLFSVKQIGFMDVVLGCLAVAMVSRFGGLRSGLLAAVALQAALVGIGSAFMWRIIPVTEFPLLLAIAPVTVCFLALSGRTSTPDARSA